MTARDLPEPTSEDRDFIEGYFDGRDPDSPQPSANRSRAYRHSWSVGRAEIEGRPIPAFISRAAASEAARKDAEQ